MGYGGCKRTGMLIGFLVFMVGCGFGVMDKLPGFTDFSMGSLDGNSFLTCVGGAGASAFSIWWVGRGLRKHTCKQEPVVGQEPTGKHQKKELETDSLDMYNWDEEDVRTNADTKKYANGMHTCRDTLATFDPNCPPKGYRRRLTTLRNLIET